MKKTYSPTSSDIKRTWYFFDAKDQVVGRLATQIASILSAKHKPGYAPHMDIADHVVVVNASHIAVTGKKETQKLYRHHSGYPGGMKVLTLTQVRAAKPERILLSAVTGMLPKNRLQSRRLKHLHIFKSDTHPFTKQFKTS